MQAIVEVGTNLAMARVAAVAEFWLGKPVLAINTTTYWFALRQSGIQDRVQGFGRLPAELVPARLAAAAAALIERIEHVPDVAILAAAVVVRD